jgi:LuxR family maltose regulon positive regulatory protein
MALSAVLEHRAAVLLGWSDAARDVVNRSQVAIPDSGELLLMKARGQLGLGRHGSAGNILRPLLDGAVTAALPWSIIEAWLVETAVALHEEQDVRARRALKRALSLAESMDVLYPLVSAELEVIEALTWELGKLGASERFAGRVLAVRCSLHVPPVPVLLTERELGVLRLLPTLRSFEEIAQDLTVSLNTVKTHVRAIYTKLGVTKRRDAVAVGVKKGFLRPPTSPSA